MPNLNPKPYFLHHHKHELPLQSFFIIIFYIKIKENKKRRKREGRNVKLQSEKSK